MAPRFIATDKDASSVFTKTKMCKFHAVGKCTKGDGCPFAHDVAELHELPDLRCTKLCKALLTYGVCNTPGCSYAHSRNELRVVAEASNCSNTKPGRAIEFEEGCAFGSERSSVYGQGQGECQSFVDDFACQPPTAYTPRVVQPPPGLDIDPQWVFEEKGRNVVNSTPQPRTAYSPLQVQPSIDMDHVFGKSSSKGASLDLGNPKYVQPRLSCMKEGPQFPSRHSQLMSEEVGASMANMFTDNLSLHMMSYNWPSSIVDPLDVAGMLETEEETSALLDKDWFSQELPATTASRLATPIHKGWGSGSTLCSLADISGL